MVPLSIRKISLMHDIVVNVYKTKATLHRKYTNIYRKILNVSPGPIEVFKHFLGGLYSGGLIFGGAYIRRAFCVSVRVSRP